MKPKLITVIDKANNLLEEQGELLALKYFQDKIEKMGTPKDFEELCKKSGWITAINYIKSKATNSHG